MVIDKKERNNYVRSYRAGKAVGKRIGERRGSENIGAGRDLLELVAALLDNRELRLQIQEVSHSDSHFCLLLQKKTGF